MKFDMAKWKKSLFGTGAKKPMPILSFPGVQLTKMTVRQMLETAENQALVMQRVSERVDAAAAVSPMDLSLEAECFGSEIRIPDDEVPCVIGRVISNLEDAKNLAVPRVGEKRTAVSLKAMALAKQNITDRPLLAGIIGPFSLAGRLTDVTEAMMLCYDEPELMHTVLEKATEFLINYSIALKAAGSDGLVMAEPLAGLLSPDLNEEFSAPYVEKIFDAVKCDDFITVYHNCGPAAIRQLPSIESTGADIIHLGNAVKLSDALKAASKNKLIMGNIDPAGIIRNGTPESVYSATAALLDECSAYENFVLSSGCDIPPLAPWENIDAFFKAAKK